MSELRRLFLETGNIDPFQCVTIASVCMALHRNKFMPQHTIAVVDDKTTTENHSRESISWTKFISQKHKVRIRHALNGGEVHLPDIGKVDGLCESASTVYEFQGCYGHRCEKCYKHNVKDKHCNEPMYILCDNTRKKNKLIREKYNLIEVWKCDLLSDPEYKKFEKPEYIAPLEPCDAFFGGRTELFRLKGKNVLRTTK